MKIVVIGGTGLIGSKVVSKLRQLGHDVIAGSPATGVDTITGAGLAEALKGANVVVDLANSPSFADDDVMNFFKQSGTNLLAGEATAGVTHHIALCVVGTSLLQESGYFRAKQVQEDLIKKSGIPYTIIHSTQFLEFLGGIVAASHDGESIKLSNAKIQPLASDDVAAMTVEFVLGQPTNSTVEIGGPERFGLADLVQNYLEKTGDPRKVIIDKDALYFGAPLNDLTLVPQANAKLGTITFEQWFPNRPVKH
jgi:uncharacterized protein YbjT (DUF2867 family)